MGRRLIGAMGRSVRLSGFVVMALIASLLAALPGAVPAAAAAPVSPVAKAAEPSCVDEAADEQAAKRLAKQCAKRVEDLSERTEFTRTFANPSGTWTLEQAVEPQRVRRGTGWVPVDTTLRLTAGRVEPRATVPSMSFSAGGQGLLARVSDRGREVGISWPGPLPSPVLSGNTALYRDVLPGVDLQLTASAKGFSEVLIVRTRVAAANPKLAKLTFGLATKDLAVSGTNGGGLVARDAQGKQVFTSSAPLMWDSSDRMVDPGKAEPAAVTPRPASSRSASRDSSWEQPAAPARPEADREPVGKPTEGAKQAVMPVEVSGSDVVVTPDRTLLDHPDAKYPVYIDPNWNWSAGPGYGWTTVWSKYPNSSFWLNDTAMLNGATYGSVGSGRVRDCDTCSQYIIRSMFQFPTWELNARTILNAQFQIEQRHAWTCSPASDVGLWLTGGIDGNTTWNNQPYWYPDYRTYHEGNHKIGAIHGCADVGTLEFNITGWVQAMAAGQWGQITVGLMAIDEGTLWQWKRYNHNTPLLLVEYNRAPNTPENKAADNIACPTASGRPYVLSTTPTLTVTQSDPDSGQQNLTTNFYWWPVGGSRNDNVTVAQSAGNGSNVSVTIPAGQLGDGNSYVWQARTWDGYDVAYSGTCEFTVDATPPAGVTGVSSSAYPADGQPHGGVGLDGSFTFNPPTLRPYEVIGYAYTLDGATQASGATQLPVSAGSGATVTIRPARDGVNTLKVWTKDQAGRYSSSPFQYTFTVRAGSGPAAEWTFNESGTNPAADVTGHNNTATLAGSATRSTGRGGVGNALTLNGSTAYAATTGPAMTPHPDTGVMTAVRTDSSFTVTARLNLAATGGTTKPTAVSADGTNASAYTLGYSGPDNRWRFAMAVADTTTTGVVTVLSDAAPTAGKWTHLAAVYDVSTHQLKLYVNGVAQTATATLSGGFNATGPVNIGRRKTGGSYADYFNGSVDDVRVYNFVESAANLTGLAKPLPPTVSFPNGNQANVNGTLSVRFDANGDTNVTSFKYSAFSPTLTLTTTPTTPGGTATVTVNVGGASGDFPVYAASSASATLVSTTSSGSFHVNQPASITGTVVGLDFMPVEGAVVTLNPGGQSMTTGSSGVYSFTGFAPGTYTVAAHFGGQCGPSTSVTLELEALDNYFDLILELYTDAHGYTCSDQTATFTPASTALALTGDNAVTQVNLPFAFPFYGHAYLNAWIDTNGLLTFEDPGGSHPYTGGTALRNESAPNAVVAPFWDDLVVDASASVRTQVLGSGASQQFLIEWRNVYRKANSSQRLSFEALLSRDGTVTTNYSDLDNAAEQGSAAAVGIESPSGLDGLVYSVNNAVLQSGRSVTFDYPGEEVPIDVYDLSGTLLNAAGSPVVGATVTLEPRGLSTVTGSGGTWSFTGLVADSYTISSSIGGRCAQAVTSVVALNANTVRDLQLAPQYGGLGYACSTGTSGYVAASTVLPLTGDGVQTQVSLPFPLTLHGRTYTTAWVGDDGFMSFGSDMAGEYWVNQPLPAATAPNAMVAPFWDDLDVDASASVRTQVLGTAPNRSFVVEWRNVRILEGSPSDRITFEVIYGENGQIGFHYAALSTDGQRGATATIGIENVDGTLGAQYSHNEAALTSNGSVVFTAAPPGTISGTVTAARLTAPVAGATVTLNPGGTTTTTDANGNYQFTSVGVGEYELSVVPNNGYCGGQFAIQTVHQAGGTTDVDLTVLGTGDGGGYTCRTGTQAFIPADDGDDHGSGDDYMIAEALPFPITLYGSTYTYGWIDSNGSITFQQSDSAWDVSPIPSPPTTARHDAAVYPFWADWVVDSQAEITHKLSGTAPNRTWSVVWNNVMNFHDQSARVTFEVIFEESGAITFTYADIDQGNATERGATATVGIENGFGTIAFQYLHRQPLLASGTSIRFEPGVVLPGTITGDVTCQGAPVANATVATNGITTTTQANGAYTLANVPGGGHMVIATPSGGACGGSHVLPATVGSGATVGLDFDLTSTPAGTGYSVAEQSFAFVPAGNVLSLSGDDDFTQVTLPFPVTHYGQTYTTAWVDTNGVVSFIPPNGSAWDTGPIPSAAAPSRPNAAIYALWDDWVVDGEASVRTATIGTAPNRTFVVEWRNVRSWEDVNTRVSFEVVFTESGGYTFAYTDLNGGFLESGGGSTIGIENADGTVALQFSYLIPAARPDVGIRFTPPTS